MWIAVALCGACAPERPACSEAALAALTAAYVAEASAACKAEGETGNYDDCKALPAIRAKYREAREEWVTCQ
jgi:hypothetical protein